MRNMSCKRKETHINEITVTKLLQEKLENNDKGILVHARVDGNTVKILTLT